MSDVKPKKVGYELILRDSILGHPMYDLLDELIEQHHDHLRTARIALAWCTSWRPDADGRVTLGMCKKASDLDREVAPFDFVILLSRAFWKEEAVTDIQRRALLDHELCHAEVKLVNGEPQEDERGRVVYRTRDHDIEEFSEIVERYGCYKRDLEKFAQALRRGEHPKFKGCDRCRDTENPGWQTVVEGNVERLKRCDCYTEYQQIRAELAS
jgi:hypothetical protein